jgi:hypothetical protein
VDFEYQAASWDKECRVIAKIEWHPGELFSKVGFIVTNLPMDPDWIVRFYCLPTDRTRMFGSIILRLTCGC